MVLFTVELRSWLHSFWRQQGTVCFSAFFCFQRLLSLWPFYHCATWEAPKNNLHQKAWRLERSECGRKGKQAYQVGIQGWEVSGAGKKAERKEGKQTCRGKTREEAPKLNGCMHLDHVELGSFVSLLAFPGRRVNSSLHFFSSVCVCVCVCARVCSLSHVWLFTTVWNIACQGFSKQEYWSGVPLPPPGDLPNPGIEPISLASPAGGFFTTAPPGELLQQCYHIIVQMTRVSWFSLFWKWSLSYSCSETLPREH